jgi:hypothetical protein
VRRLQARPQWLLRATVLPCGPFHWGTTCAEFHQGIARITCALARFAWCRSPRSPGTTAHTPISDVETCSRLTGPPWRALPAEFCPLKPPPVAKGWEVRMPPAPVSPPMIFAERRPWKPGAEKGAGGSNVTPGFTFNVYYLPRLPMSYRSQWLRPSSVEGSSTPLPKIAYRTCTARLA